jgi:hypothetical protein
MLFKVAGIGASGVVSDIAPHELPPSVWTNSNNIRFFQGYAQSVFHDVQIINDETQPNISTDYAYGMIGFDEDKIAYASGSSLYVYTGTIHEDYTGTTTPTASTDWVSLLFSNTVVFSNIATIPQALLPGAATYIDLTDWDSNWRTHNIVGYKNFLLALNTVESGFDYPQRIRWSDASEPNNIPASWDATDPATLAGFNDLTDAFGYIVTGKTLSDVLYIYTSREIFAVQYIGEPSIFNFRKINGNVGLLSRKAICEYKGKHVFMSKDDVYLFDGVNVQSIISGKIREQLFQDINIQYIDQIQIVARTQYNEVWITYPNQNSTGVNTRAAVYNVETQTWSFRRLDNYVEMAVIRKPSNPGVLWNNATYVWDSTDAYHTWNEKDFGSDVLIGSTSSGKFMMVDQVDQSNYNIVSTLERKYIDLDDAGAPSTNVKAIRSIYPQFQGSGKIYVHVGTSNSSLGPITWEAPKPFVIGTDTRVDFRTSGRYVSIKFVSTSKNVSWRFTGYDVEFDNRFRGKAK